jgi:hypothetical protein
LGRLTNAVSTLGLAFYFTGRDEYAAHVTLAMQAGGGTARLDLTIE